MSRQTSFIVKSEPVRTQIQTITCDKCGRSLNHDGDENEFPNELIILLNQEECVSQRFRKDLCTECLEPIWQAICIALGVDPDDESGSDFDGD
jgi:hypothetical protein